MLTTFQLETASTYVVTLSRAHKVADRLRQKMTEAQGQALAALKAEAIPVERSDAVIKELDARVSQGVELASKARRFSAAYARVRNAIGHANVMNEVGLALAEREHLLREIQHLKAVIAGLRSGTMSREVFESLDADKLQAMKSANPIYGHGPSIRICPESIIAKFEDELAQVQRQEMRLSDQLADLNAGKVTLSVPADIAEELSLVE